MTIELTSGTGDLFAVSASSTGRDTEAFAIDYTDILDGSETLTGTPTVTGKTGGLTLTSKQLNSAAITVRGRSVAASKAVQFLATGFVKGTTYRIRVTVSTNATTARVFVRDIRVKAI